MSCRPMAKTALPKLQAAMNRKRKLDEGGSAPQSSRRRDEDENRNEDSGEGDGEERQGSGGEDVKGKGKGKGTDVQVGRVRRQGMAEAMAAVGEGEGEEEEEEEERVVRVGLGKRLGLVPPSHIKTPIGRGLMNTRKSLVDREEMRES